MTEWLADPAQARWHLHFTPTSSSWLNLVERWFGRAHRPPAPAGVFGSVAELIKAIELWAKHWNDDPKPFMWTQGRGRDHREGPPRTGCTAPGQIRDGSLDG